MITNSIQPAQRPIEASSNIEGVERVEVARQWEPDPLGNVVKALVPDAVIFGESHGNTLLGTFGRGGNFALINTNNGSVSYFGSQYLGPAPPLPTPGGIANGAFSVVGTAGAREEAGFGVAYKLPTPVGDVLFFLNGRQDAAAAGSLRNILQGKVPGTQTVSVNFGAAYSASDGAVRLLAGSVPGGLVAGAALEIAGVDGWIGLGWRGSATFENGKLKSINISGVEIPASQIAQVLGNELQKARQSPPLMPNFGNRRLASMNNDIQMAFGQSPWDVAFSSILRDRLGIIKIFDGTVDVLNHGNRATAVAEPVYELGVRYRVLLAGQRILNNAHAGQVVEAVLNRAMALDLANEARGQKTTWYVQALNAFMNPYHLNHGSPQLRNAHEMYVQDPSSLLFLNVSRAAQGLPPLPYSRPDDYAVVRGIYQGNYRWERDLGTPSPTQREGFRL